MRTYVIGASEPITNEEIEAWLENIELVYTG
jgi:hypothetical protein